MIEQVKMVKSLFRFFRRRRLAKLFADIFREHGERRLLKSEIITSLRERGVGDDEIENMLIDAEVYHIILLNGHFKHEDAHKEEEEYRISGVLKRKLEKESFIGHRLGLF